MAEMPELFEGRVAYFDLCLQAVLKSQVKARLVSPLNVYLSTVASFSRRPCTTVSAVVCCVRG